MTQVVVLLVLLLGLFLTNHFEFWDKLFASSSKIIYMPQYIGFLPTVIIQITVLIGLYLFADWYDKKNKFIGL